MVGGKGLTILESNKIVKIPFGINKFPDGSRRRYLSWGMDFDTRAIMLEAIPENWDLQVREQHKTNQQSIIEGLIHQYGNLKHVQKIKNFKELGSKPFSVVAQHSGFFDSIRNAFVIEAYYPALVAACALGERILNHLILDLRHHFKSSKSFPDVEKTKSFSNWVLAISTLEDWGVLLDGIPQSFAELSKLRHKSIHFNANTYANVRVDSLRAIQLLRHVIEHQFGSFGLQPWFIEGTQGNCFIKKAFESHPFVMTYILPRCPLVGTLHTLKVTHREWLCFDFASYGAGDLTDSEFAERYNSRQISDMANTELDITETLQNAKS
jgi:hypothetical protein